MNVEDMIIISVDDHIVEPPDLFKKHLSPQWLEKAPTIHRIDGVDHWVYEGRRLVNFALNAVVGRPREELGFEPTAFEQIRKAAYDVHARIDDMNVNGILASACFGTFAQFAGEMWARSKDKTISLRMVQAYNDWHFDEWCGSYPHRFIPMATVPLWDMDEAIAELKRLVKKGARAVSLPPVPTQCGLPSIHDAYWQPMWRFCNDEGVAVCLHISGSTGGSEALSADSPIESVLTKAGLCAMSVASEWMFSKMLREYADLKIVFSEGGIGWIPYILERADVVYKDHGPWTGQNFGGKLPSDIYREHCFSCFIVDAFGVQNRDKVGVDTITYECDYPHADVTWPHSPEELMGCMGGVPDIDIDKICHLNAMRAFHADPVSSLGRENCTVGALRAKATHVDVAPRSSLGGHPPTRDPSRVVTAGDVAAQFDDRPSLVRETAGR